MSHPEDFNTIPPEPSDENALEQKTSPEQMPVRKEDVIEALKEKGLKDPEAEGLLQKYTEEVEERGIAEGRLDARTESWREKAHILLNAGLPKEALAVMQDVAEITQTEGDTAGYDEALWIIGKLQARINPPRLHSQPPEEPIVLDESGEKVERDRVIEMLAPFSYVGDPAHLDMNHPEAAKAEELAGQWILRGDVETAGDTEKSLKHELDKIMLYVDAGFHDKDYLEDVLEWLGQNAGDAPAESGNEARAALRREIASAIKKVRHLIAEKK